MTSDAKPVWNEEERLAALHRTRLLDTPPEQAIDDLVRMAAELLDMPMAAVHLIDSDRQWGLSELGLGVREMPRDIAFCAHTIHAPGVMVVPDARLDPRFAANPLVTGAPGIRFYAGEPLEVDGQPIGALCVIDTKPHDGLDQRQRFVMKTLAAQVVSQIALRQAAAERLRVQAVTRQTLNSTTEFAIISLDLAGRVTGWNFGASNVLGWSEAEMLGQPVTRIFLAEDVRTGRLAQEMQQALATGRAECACWMLRRDGVQIWASGEVSPLRDEDGRSVGFVKVLLDATRAHQDAAALLAVNERYRMVSRATNDAVWDWDLRENTVLWNEALQQAYGHAPRDAVPTGDWWMEQIHAADRPGVSNSIHAVIDGSGTAWQREYRFRRADDSYADVLDRGFVIRDEAGRALRMIGAMLDLSASKQAALALRGSEDRLRLAMQAARLGTFDYLLPTGELIWDDRCSELFGLTPGTPVSYEGTFLPGLHPSDREPTGARVSQLIAGGVDSDIQLEYRTVGLEDGVLRWVAAHGRMFFENGQAVRFTGTVLDITESKRAEAQLREMNDTLEQRVEERTRSLREAEETLRQSQKMEAVGQLTGGLAHDFNNLLAGISGSLELVESRLAQGRTQGLEAFIGAAKTSARRAAALTHRLLAFSRRQTLDPRPTDVNRLVAEMEELVRRTVSRAIVLTVDGADGLWNTLVDPNQLENALLNLCINARDAMPNGGRLRITTANAALTGRAATGHGLPPGDYVMLSVSDTGSGMTPEVARKAFDPFFTTKPIGQGTGLGLSMIYGFVRQSGGVARIDSAPGRGTIVSLWLPRAEGEADEAPAGHAPRTTTPAAPEQTVLVVDDEPAVRMVVAEVLTDLGYAAIEAADSESGLALLRSNARIDLLITDVGLPGGMNGPEMVERAMDQRPALKVLFITGFAETGALTPERLGPDMQVLPKPFAIEDLASRIRALIG